MEAKLNNPGIDLEIWEQLKKKWSDLVAEGHQIKVDFKLIAHPNNENNILAIDVIQTIDEKVVVETVQRVVREAYAALSIAGLSMERLVEVYKEMMRQLHYHAKPHDFDMDLVVTMSHHSANSGEVEGLLVHPDAPVQSSVPVNYRYYYVLNALWEKMTESTGDAWSKVRAVYHSGDLEFYFEY
jgi:hypothetical protein